MHLPFSSVRAARRQRGTALLLACWIGHGTALAAPGDGAPPPDAPAIVRSLAVLARSRPATCEQPQAAPPDAWLVRSTQCVWRGRLVMRRWMSGGGNAPSCVSAPAAWWHWRRAASPGAASLPVWNAAWRRQAIAPQAGDQGGTQTISLLAEAGDGAWAATEWRWTPPASAATRAWEGRRWEQLRLAVQGMNDASADAAAPLALEAIWRRNLRGRPAERVGAAFVWQGEQQCLRLLAADKAQDPAVPLPYAREDSRLEQRAAVQVQLARGAPGASWPVPFHLMPQTTPRQRGAAYAAIARRERQLIGRLWLPRRSEQTPLSARIEAPLAAPPGSPGEARAVSALEREMAALGELWVADHGR